MLGSIPSFRPVDLSWGLCTICLGTSHLVQLSEHSGHVSVSMRADANAVVKGVDPKFEALWALEDDGNKTRCTPHLKRTQHCKPTMH